MIDDVDIEILGGFPLRTEKDAQRKIPKNSKGYPENRMFGVLPAHGFYIRHAKDIEMTNIRVAIMQEDARSAFVLDDVHDSVFHGVCTESVTPTSPFSVQSNCTGVDVNLNKKCATYVEAADPAPDSTANWAAAKQKLELLNETVAQFNIPMKPEDTEGLEKQSKKVLEELSR